MVAAVEVAVAYYVISTADVVQLVKRVLDRSAGLVACGRLNGVMLW